MGEEERGQWNGEEQHSNLLFVQFRSNFCAKMLERGRGSNEVYFAPIFVVPHFHVHVILLMIAKCEKQVSKWSVFRKERGVMTCGGGERTTRQEILKFASSGSHFFFLLIGLV